MQKSCYDPSFEIPALREEIIGKNVLEFNLGSACCDIAGLDAIYSHLVKPPDETFYIDGTNFQKAISRSEIIINESLAILSNKVPKNGNKFIIVNVGVVSQFLELLSKKINLIIKASDFYKEIVGKQFYGVEISHGRKTNEIIANADLAIVTGMTLYSGTLDGILSVARENKTKIVIFAETGANFASEYCRLGVDLVVSEPLPFYLSGPGKTTIRLYRNESNV